MLVKGEPPKEVLADGDLAAGEIAIPMAEVFSVL